MESWGLRPGVLVGSSGSSLRPSARVLSGWAAVVDRGVARWWCARGLVGLLFEICIVDASIFAAAHLLRCVVACMCVLPALPCLEGVGGELVCLFDWGVDW